MNKYRVLKGIVFLAGSVNVYDDRFDNRLFSNIPWNDPTDLTEVDDSHSRDYGEDVDYKGQSIFISEWVSVKDKEPPKDGTCIWGFFPEKAGYFADQRYIPIHWSEWGGGTWDNTSSGHHISGSPTHWMPLPNPPTNEGKE